MAENVGRVVLDTNVLVSAVLFGGEPERLMGYVRSSSLRGVTSLYILREFQDVLTRPKFGIDPFIAQALAVEIGHSNEIVAVEGAGGPWSTDSDDDPIIETALVVGATHLVTGDRRLLETRVPSLRIVTVTKMLELLEGS